MIPPAQLSHFPVQTLPQMYSGSEAPGAGEVLIWPRPICVQQGQPVLNSNRSPVFQVFSVPCPGRHVAVSDVFAETLQSLRAPRLNTRWPTHWSVFHPGDGFTVRVVAWSGPA